MTSVGTEDPLGINQVFVYALMYQHKFTEKFQYVLQHDLGTSTHGDPRTGGQRRNGTISTSTSSIRSTRNGRRECVSNGSRIPRAPAWQASATGSSSNRGWLGLPGFAGNFYELTAGLNWHINPNAVLRPEVRYDWYDGSRNIAGQLPFNNGNNAYQFLYATDLVITF